MDIRTLPKGTTQGKGKCNICQSYDNRGICQLFEINVIGKFNFCDCFKYKENKKEQGNTIKL